MRGGSANSDPSDAAVTSLSFSSSLRSSSSGSRDAFSPECSLTSLTSLSASPEPKKPTIVVCGQKLEPTIVFDTLWRWLVERKAMYDSRCKGMPAPWTQDPILRHWKFCNAYRVLDRTSQFVVTEVIERGSQDRTELLFRILLFNCFNRIETWTLLKDAFGGALTYAQFDLDAYNKVLRAALDRKQSLFTNAYMKIGKKYDYHENHMHYLQQLQILMRDLPPILDSARYAADVFERIAAYPGMGNFMAYQLMLSLSYSPLLNFAANDFVVPGLGASSGLTKMFGASLRHAKQHAPDIEAQILRWMASTQRTHFARLGLTFAYLRGANGAEHALDVADLEHAVCEVDKYARKAHPRIRGLGTRTNFRGSYHEATARPLDAVPALPRAWADPARRVARVRATPVEVEKRWCVLKVLAERATPDENKAVHGDEWEYQVSWLGSYAPTWEPRYSIAEDAPELVEEFKARNKSGSKGKKIRKARR
ncbi:hypothetical protein B0H15DRAFT_787908 [Mycena belliarum]|uniref:Chromo domain-containing protein n=1 Tax=Mycena belliarum TaxID=1033014 RepID=A0AAD6TZG6_9AGAR|nr:hypothetical protein B0H15DRAFT_787908 [Mycena belliae]